MRDLESNIVLLLTGTVVPNSKDVLALKDPNERKLQYIKAIEFYLLETNFDIVFTENSGTSLESHFPESNRLEFLIFNSPVSLKERGKGFKEMEIIDYSIKNSKLISKAKGIFKITGRLQVLNVASISVDILSKNSNTKNEIICNIYKAFKMDSRGFYFSKNFWPYLKKCGEMIDISYSFERALWKAVIEYDRINERRYRQFSEPLKIKGMSGGLGITYKHGVMLTLARKIRHIFMIPFVYRKFQRK